MHPFLRQLSHAGSTPALLCSLVMCCVYLYMNKNAEPAERISRNEVVRTEPPALGPLEEETVLAFQGVDSCQEMLELPRGRTLHESYDAQLHSFARKRVIDASVVEMYREKERELLRMLGARLPDVKHVCMTSVTPLADLYVWFISNKNSMVYLVGSSEMDIKGVSTSVLHWKFKRRVKVPIKPVSQAGFKNLQADCDLFVISELTDESVWNSFSLLKKLARSKHSYLIFEGYRKGAYLAKLWDEAVNQGTLTEMLKCNQNKQGKLYDIIAKIIWDG